MLKDTLFKIVSSEHKENIIHATLEVDENSEIFEGHFPGHPVLPGACMLQMVKEVLEDGLNTPVRLKKADHIKFLSLVIPGHHSALQLNVSYTSDDGKNLYVIASLTAQKHVCFKFKGSFSAI